MRTKAEPGRSEELPRPVDDVNLYLNEDEQVSLLSLSQLTGFPIDFIKKELFVEEDNLSLKDLRKSMGEYLERNFDPAQL